MAKRFGMTSGMRFCVAILSCLFSAGSLWGSVDSILNPTAVWSRLDAFQGKWSRQAFERAMDGVYSPNADWRIWIQVEAKGAWIEETETLGGSRYWMAFGTASQGGPAKSANSLEGMRIALDPGHIGGAWGPIEERSFRVGDQPIVQEGDLVLAACQRAASRLRSLGAEVWLTREDAEPVTPLRGEDFLEEAKRRLGEGASEEELSKLAERLFYRTAEIWARAEALAAWQPDIALALHINASSVEDPENQPLHGKNDMHILVNGCYLAEELADPAQRFAMLWRLFNRYHEEERELAFGMKRAMREAIDLPPYVYGGGNAYSLDIEKYVFARNLLANRVFDCPVVYLEPWQANSVEVYRWAAAGDYEGTREIGGISRRSLPAVYADFVVQGVLYRLGD